MSYLLDSNIVSELRKRERVDLRVRDWFAGVAMPSDDTRSSSVMRAVCGPEPASTLTQHTMTNDGSAHLFVIEPSPF